MGKIDYLYIANNDFEFMKDIMNRGYVSNILCRDLQNICEKYLKHVIDINKLNINVDCTSILRTHSIKALIRFIKNNVPEFKCNFETVLLSDGYYFSVNYPGDDYFDVTAQDIEECWEGVKEARSSVMEYVNNLNSSRKAYPNNAVARLCNQLKSMKS